MAANTQAPFVAKGDIQWGSAVLITANTAYDGTGSNQITAFTASSTNGDYVQRIRFRAAGTNIPAVGRVFINNGSTMGTAANNILWDEITLSQTIYSQTSATATYELPLNFWLPASYVLFCTIGTTVASGYYVSVIGGAY